MGCIVTHRLLHVFQMRDIDSIKSIDFILNYLYHRYMNKQFHSAQCNVSPENYKKIRLRAITLGFRGVSAYLIHLLAKDIPELEAEE